MLIWVNIAQYQFVWIVNDTTGGARPATFLSKGLTSMIIYLKCVDFVLMGLLVALGMRASYSTHLLISVDLDTLYHEI